MDTVKIDLVVERSDSRLWGSINYNDNLIVEEAVTIDDLKERLKTLLCGFEDVETENVVFDVISDGCL